MQPIVVHVFVSSTWLDLKPERAAVEAVLQKFRETKFVGMEYFGSRDETTRQASLDEVDRSDLYIGIIGGRYGSGITEAEYRQAQEKKLPCIIYFKAEDAIQPDGRDATDQQADDLKAFKAALRDQTQGHLVTAFVSAFELASKVAADLHNWLFDKYLAPALEKAAVGTIAQEEVQALRQDLRNFGSINRRLLTRLRTTGVNTLGDRSLAAETIDQSVILTGDVYQSITQQYPILKDYVYTEFSDLIAALTREFVGRKSVFEKLDEFRRQNDRGYFHIAGDAGLGKTALAAEIARRFQAVPFFVNASSGRTHPAQCLRHLCAELIIRFSLVHDHLPDRAGKDSAFLNELLRETVQKTNQPLWVIVDALDEADEPIPGRNHLLLPDRLPVGVYVVLTHRGELSLTTDAQTPTAQHQLSSDDAEQRADIEAYLQRQAERDEIRELLAGANPPVQPNEFVGALRQVSEGNFKYLEYVISDIEHQEQGFAPIHLATLPRGLTGYYKQFWLGIETVKGKEGWAEWNGLYRPVIALLGVAGEPVSVDWLAAHISREADEIRERALIPWQRFLSRGHRDSEETWRIVHKSFSDFLAEKLDLPAAHRAVATYYRNDSSRWVNHRRYASRHLTAHLSHGGDRQALFDLVDDRAWYEFQIIDDPSGGAYVSDLAQAWTVAETQDIEAARQTHADWLLDREVRCALGTASLRSISERIPPTLLTALVTRREWPRPSQALAVVRQYPDWEAKNTALEALAPSLPEVDLREAINIARAIENAWFRARTLAALASYLPAPENEELRREALVATQGIGTPHDRARVLVSLLPKVTGHLKEEVLNEALAATRATKDAEVQAGLLASLIEYLFIPTQIRNDVTLEALAVLSVAVAQRESRQRSGAEYELSKAFAALALHLSDPLKDALQTRVLTIARGAEAKSDRVIALAPLIPLLKASQRLELITEALALLREALEKQLTARHFLSESSWDDALIALLPHLSAEQKQEALKEALDVARAMQDAAFRMDALFRLFPYLDAPQKDAVLQDLLTGIRADEFEDVRSNALAALLPLLSEPQKERVLREALAGSRKIGDADARVDVLATLATYLPAEERDRLLEGTVAVARSINSPDLRAKAFAALAIRLAEAGHAQQALDAIDEIDVRRKPLTALVTLASNPLVPRKEEILHEALAVVRSMWSFDIGESLAQIAPYLSPPLLDEALAMARARHDGADRVGAFAALVPYLSAPLKDEVLREALGEVRSAQVLAGRALKALTPHLPQPMLEEALATAQAIGDASDRAEALASLVSRLPILQRETVVRDALADVHASSYRSRAAALVALVPHLPQSLLDEALTMARAMEDGGARVEMLVSLVSRLSPPLKDAVAQEALNTLQDELIAQQSGASIPNEYGLALSLAELVVHLTGPLLQKAVVVAAGINNTVDRRRVLAALSLYLIIQPLPELHSLWSVTLRRLAVRTRRDLLSDLCSLSPVLLKLGGTESVAASTRAIQEVCRQWP